MPTIIIEDQLVAWINSQSNVMALATGGVYPYGEVPEDVVWPFVTYFRVHGNRVRTLRGPSGFGHAAIQIGCHAQVYGQCKQISDALIIAMDAFGRGMMGSLYVQSMITSDSRDYGPQQDEYIRPLFGDEVAQPCVSFDVTIWFEEGA